MGKHSRKRKPVYFSYLGKTTVKRRRRLFFKWFLISLLVFLLAGSATVYAYIKFLENRMHASGNLKREIARLLSKPAPDEPINFLIIGTDVTPKEDRGRSDTLIILRVDLAKNKGTLISIPRDFRVNIPGYGKDKINHAYSYGGIPLSITTVENFTGLDIHHYIVVNFNGFEALVNAIGGVTIDVEKRLVDWELGEPIEAGRQRMDGLTALHYVRFRNDPEGDFGRIKRQQKFFRALISESTRIRNAYKLPQLARIVSKNVQTDLTFSEILSLARNIRDIKQKNLETVMLPGTPQTIDGISYVIPDEEKVELILNLIKQGKPIDKALLEDIPPSEISVKVLNGCGVEGAAGEIGEILANEGFEVVEIGNADKDTYRKTTIYYSKRNYAKALQVKKILKEDLTPVLKETKNVDSVDVLVIVGQDY